jgi:hypothetical protein
MNVCKFVDCKCIVCGAPKINPIQLCGSWSHPEPSQFPGGVPFLEKAKNFAAATVQHVAAGMPMASDEEIVRRHDICLTCEHLQDGACNLCGCPVSRVAGYVSKLSWADQECPAGKWGRADGK